MTRRLVLLFAVALGALGSVPAAQASCVPAPPLRQAVREADIAFVGTVVALDHDGRTATFRVEDVWKGVVPETVVVHGGPGIEAIESAAARGEGVASSGDRTYGTGTRYLVLPWGRTDGVLRDSICSSTQPYSDGMANLRPAAAHRPYAQAAGAVPASSADEGGSGPLLWTFLGGLAALGAVLTALLVRLRTRRAA
jgi:hypothetical protein